MKFNFNKIYSTLEVCKNFSGYLNFFISTFSLILPNKIKKSPFSKSCRNKTTL